MYSIGKQQLLYDQLESKVQEAFLELKQLRLLKIGFVQNFVYQYKVANLVVAIILQTPRYAIELTIITFVIICLSL